MNIEASAHALSHFTELARGFYFEGLAIDDRRGIVWCSDVTGGGIHGVDGKGRHVATLDAERRWTGGIVMNADGRVLSSGQSGIRWNDPDSGRSGWLLRELDGEPINGINEMAADARGGLFFGTCDIDNVIAGRTPRPTAIHHLDREGRTACVASGLGFVNGMMHDAQRARFYCNDSFNCVWQFDVTGDLALTNRRLFHRKEDADGMALDAEGNVWITGFASRHIVRLRPDGSQLPAIDLPQGPATQIRFAANDPHSLFLTAIPADGGQTLKEGGAITQLDSILYRARSAPEGQAAGSPDFAW